jgi:hypothetical protein
MTPRRNDQLARLIEFLAFRGGKIFLDDSTLRTLRRDCGLSPWQVNSAVDGGYAVGLISAHMAGGLEVVTLEERRA